MRNLDFCAIVFFLFFCKAIKAQDNSAQRNYYHFAENRVAAEWEPAKGVIFYCPPVIPKELIIELSRDSRIFPTVDSEEEKARALEWFLKWEIDTSRVEFIVLPNADKELAVPRDWGPAAIFTRNGTMKVADVDFKNSNPVMNLSCSDSLELQKINGTEEDLHSFNADTLILPFARQLGLETLEVPITTTGGNLLTDGIGTAFSTCILLAENRFNGISEKEFFTIGDSLLGLTNYHVISNFDQRGIQHIDCFLKVIDEETLLVAQPPADHHLYPIYESIVANELAGVKNAYGRPYEIKRLKLGRVVEEYLAAYTNSLILNKTVYVPLYGLETDAFALDTWKAVMPGYKIKGINFNIIDQPYIANWYFEPYLEFGEVPGWAPDDAVHCRTRALWDEEMIFISLNKVLTEQPVDKAAILYATIRDYGNTGFGEQAIRVYWRVNGNEEWNVETMTNDENEFHWYLKFPVHKENSKIEYYVEATSKTGETGKRPITAPDGFYTFTYVSQ